MERNVGSGEGGERKEGGEVKAGRHSVEGGGRGKEGGKEGGC